MDELDRLAEEVLNEIEQEYKSLVMRPGDITTRQVADKLGCTYSTARDLMRKKVKDGEFECVKVRNPDSGREVAVFRKVKKNDSTLV